MIEINLLKEKTKDKKRKKGVSINISNVVFIAIVLIAIEIVALVYVSYLVNNTLDGLKRERNRLSVIERQVSKIRVKVKEVKNMIEAVKKLEKGRGEAAEILEEVADAIPKGSTISNDGVVSISGSLWLTKLSKKGKTVSIEGKSFSAEAVADYMIRLESLKNVDKVRFSSRGLRKVYSRGGVDVYAFSIVVTLKG